MAKVTFNNNNNLFFQSLKDSVENYFKKENLKKTGNWRLYSKAAILIPSALLIYILLLSLKMPVVVGILLCAILGLIISSIGFNIMHDACHGSYSSKKWVNTLLGYSLNAIGGNAFFGSRSTTFFTIPIPTYREWMMILLKVNCCVKVLRQIGCQFIVTSIFILPLPIPLLCLCG